MSIPSYKLSPLVQKYFEEVTLKHNPSASVRVKDDSPLMKAIAFILKPVNPKFLSLYITTIGSTIYIPKIFETLNDYEMLEILVHETQHVIDYTKNRAFFVCSYLFPQCLALLSILSLGAFANPWMLLWLLALLTLAPIPAPWRYKWELNGYRTSILFFFFRNKAYSQEGLWGVHQWVQGQMTTGAYYFAWPFAVKIEKDLSDLSVFTQPRYQETWDFLNKHHQAFGVLAPQDPFWSSETGVAGVSK